MAENPLREIARCGQSVWNDFIRRTFVTGGDLERLVKNDGLGGVTSNPTIFEKAIGGSPDYDDELKDFVASDAGTEQIFQELAAKDVQMAADVMLQVYENTNGHDGFVSIEVSPDAAHDTEKTLKDAHVLSKLVDRPNVMIKVPASPEGLPAIEQLIYEGTNVNVTLIFAVEVYQEVIEAYLRGLERRVKDGLPIDRIASVASFFVSRVDTLVDKRLADQSNSANESRKKELQALEGKAAIANAKIAYQRFQEVFSSDRFRRLAEKGAQLQRPLWASTSTKNPNFPDTMYVEALIGKDTVNTMPPQTIVAVRDHGVIRCDAIEADVDEAHQVIKRLGAVGIQMRDVTDQLTKDGIELFAGSAHQLFATIEEKSNRIVADTVSRDAATLDGHQAAVDKTLQDMTDDGFLTRLWNKEPALWKSDPGDQSEITGRLGWLHVSDCMMEQRNRFSSAAEFVRDAGFSHAVVLGMGGSSLAPLVLTRSFGRQRGFPELLVLDSTDPEAILAVEQAVDLEKTLFLVSTKSGTTTETLSFFETFWEKVKQRVGDRAGQQFVAITDPGTPLQDLAAERGFRETYLNPSDIGGRYSALSYFGLIPAAVMGIDVEKLLARAGRMEHACAPSVPPSANPGSWLGAILANLAKEGKNKVTFFASPELDTLGLWLEQLLAESTGKEGKGLVPVSDCLPATPSGYASDRLLVYIRLKSSSAGAEMDGTVDGLEAAGHPVVRVELDDLYDVGGEFFRWEFATAVAGALLGINAFDQPNVQESKDNTKRVLDKYLASGSLPEPEPLASHDGITLFGNSTALQWLTQERGAAQVEVPEALEQFFSRIDPPQYLAVMAYLAPSTGHDEALQPLRVMLRDALRVATTLGYGPRFLHSTGQLHKGGPPQGIFLQFTANAATDVRIPDARYSYQTLIHAQALGDLQSLEQHGRPAVRLHLPDESDSTVRRAVEMVLSAVKARSGTGAS